MASSWSLPFDLIEYIFSRAPIESLVRCKPTRKQWYALFKDKRFIYNHLHLSKERLMRFYPDKVEIINLVTLDLLSLPVPAEFGNVTYHNDHMYVIHCNGLLLCRWAAGGGSRNNKVAVWNPVLGQLKFVESKSHHEIDTYGFGYDNDSYKILRGCIKRKVFYMYDFKSKLWRAFSATMDWCICMPDQNVSMNGNMYWLALTRYKTNQETFIQSFDFSKETFKPLCSLPFEKRISVARPGIADSVAFSGFRGDRLSLFRQLVEDETREMDVWVTNKVTDEVVSWSKYFNVTRPDLPILGLHFRRCLHAPTFFIHKTNSILLWCEKVVGEGYACSSFYEIGQGEIKRQVKTGQTFRGEGERNPSVCRFVYVPSLVPVPE